ANFSEPMLEFAEQTNAPMAGIAGKNTGNGAGNLIFLTRQHPAASLSEKMRIMDSGNVGIGTTSPSTYLDVQRPNGTSFGQIARFGAFNSNAYMLMSSSSDHAAIDLNISDSTNTGVTKALTISTGTNERVRVTAAGNVGIGTSVPTASLEVQNPGTSGNIRVISSLAPAQTTGYIFQNLGKTQTNNNSAQIMYYHSGDGLTSNRFGLGFHGTSEYLSVLAGGDVGIGTTAPNGKLQVMGQIMATGAASHNVANSIRLDSSGSGASRISALGPNNATRGSFQIDLYSADGSVGASPFQISNAGNIGIGGSPTGARLAVTGNLTVTSGSVMADGTTSRLVSGMPGTAGATGPVCYNGGGAFDACSSLKKFKTEIEPLEVGLDFLMLLNPVTYRLKGTNTHEMGFIAEDMYALDPRFAVISTDGNLAGVKYDKITSLLTKSVQELRHEKDREISSLKKQLEDKSLEVQMMKSYLCSKDPSAPFCK
ncbi:MAG: tail fiber domain-containing protein, partial [Bdellovibrionales bacterium]|nr:tail fiber domain-containing protein [Bdellovibrionales bacterium]